MSGVSDDYALRSGDVAEVAAPDLPYRPPGPREWRPRIGVIGAGGIVGAHLDAYRTAGWDVVAIANRTVGKAEARAAEFFPDARVAGDWRALVDDPGIDVLDITPHPEVRGPMIEAALRAGKHVLSQKPFVTDLDEGERLCALADERGVRLAVNQNGRWAPHMAWMRAAVEAGLIGRVTAVHARVHWDHGWVAGTPFDAIPDLILYDFGIHWFDFLTSVAGRAERVFATSTRVAGQAAAVPLAAEALVTFGGGQGSLVFDGSVPVGSEDSTFIGGTEGSLTSRGPDLSRQSVTLTTRAGRAVPALEGQWFNDGFRGAMGELLSAVEDGREPSNGARGNLDGLALAFAAILSAREGRSVAVGEARRIGA